LNYSHVEAFQLLIPVLLLVRPSRDLDVSKKISTVLDFIHQKLLENVVKPAQRRSHDLNLFFLVVLSTSQKTINIQTAKMLKNRKQAPESNAIPKPKPKLADRSSGCGKWWSRSLVLKYRFSTFGTIDNLLLPRHGSDMSDGWETGSSREEGHSDWVIIRLGTSGYLNRIVIDTAYFKGNFLQQVKVEGGFECHGCEKDDTEWNKMN
jgi:hypothetical protein